MIAPGNRLFRKKRARGSCNGNGSREAKSPKLDYEAASSMLGLPRPINEDAAANIFHALGLIPGEKLVTWTGVFASGSFKMCNSQIKTTTRSALSKAWARLPLLAITVCEQLPEQPGQPPMARLWAFRCDATGLRKLAAHEFAASYRDPESDEVFDF